MLNRRSFLARPVVTFTGTGLIAWLGRPINAKAKSSADKDTVKIIQFSDSGQSLSVPSSDWSLVVVQGRSAA